MAFPMPWPIADVAGRASNRHPNLISACKPALRATFSFAEINHCNIQHFRIDFALAE
jgi:hypothetical protein